MERFVTAFERFLDVVERFFGLDVAFSIGYGSLVFGIFLFVGLGVFGLYLISLFTLFSVFLGLCCIAGFMMGVVGILEIFTTL